MFQAARAPGYSATVDLKLIVGERTLELGQIGPGMICLREPFNLPCCEATVVMTVEGRERHWPVFLPDGLSRSSAWARTVVREPAPSTAD